MRALCCGHRSLAIWAFWLLFGVILTMCFAKSASFFLWALLCRALGTPPRAVRCRALVPVSFIRHFPAVTIDLPPSLSLSRFLRVCVCFRPELRICG
ncbi:hypothetical protein DFP72DRAFT_868145 [Ephemerocybe angulata]|uniref:Uncharacterized protein n=1 Tax=Ephemerocybe angulata TaxID=980116 RepID=A0A8H6IJG9_9AGAR|nr:hypothetical protein DFP72DRAFT_868145 [Tulosesus angulatus]